MAMLLAKGQRCAERLIAWLSQFADRVEVAGSIRRGKPEVGDVDLVIIPKLHVDCDMFGTAGPTRNLTWLEIDRRASAEKWSVPRAGAEIVSVIARDIQVDIFWATPLNWGTVLMQRTGSKEHNIWLSNFAIVQGGKWHPNVGLYVRDRRFSESEEQIYQALGISFIPPDRREAHLLPSAGLCRPGAGRLLST